MKRWRVEFFIGATVSAADRQRAMSRAKRQPERRYGPGLVQAIEEQTNAIVAFAVPSER